MATTMTERQTDQLCTFRLGNLFLGIDVLDVREVLQTAEITEVPHAHEAVEGLINLRGQIATAVNLRKRLEVDLESDESAEDAETEDDLDEETPVVAVEAAATHESAETQAMAQALAEQASRSLHVVIISDDEPVTLMVDAIGDVVDVDRTSYEVPPPTLSGSARRFIRGAYKLDGELLLLLDLQRLVTLEEPDAPDASL